MTHRSDWIACALLTCAWIVPLALIGTAGEFPLNDDWSYARTIQTLLETGRFERPAWTWAPSVSNVAVGVAFSELFGHSFQVLRLSGVFMGWLGLLGAYALARQLGLGVGRASLAASITGFNPAYLNLAYSFMTDVPFLVFTTWSLFFLARGIPSLRMGPLLFGLLFAVAATLSRQLGLALAVAVGLTFLATRLREPRKLLIGVGLALGVATLYELSPLLYGAGDSGRRFTLSWYVRHTLFAPGSAHAAARNLFVSWVYLGLFLAPAAAWALPGGPRGRRLLAAGTGLAVSVLGVLLWLDWPMPIGMNILWDTGLGPRTLRGQGDDLAGPAWLWWAITAVSLWGASLLFAKGSLDLWQRRARLVHEGPWLLLAVFAFVYLSPLLVRWAFFDRWLIPCLPALSALVLIPPRGRSTPRAPRALLTAALGLPLALYAVIGTRDHLEHHRARSSLLDGLLAQGVPPARIDGGFEFNGWHNFDHPDRRFIGGLSRWVVDPEYVLSTAAEMEGYRALHHRDVRHWLLPRVERIQVFQRVASAAAAPEQPAEAEAAEREDSE